MGGDNQNHHLVQGATPMTITSAVVRVFRWFDDLIDAAMPAIRGMVVIMLGATLWLAADRETPFRVIGIDQPPPIVAPGGVVIIRADVWRDVDRSCSMKGISRMHFSDGTRFDLPVREFSAQELREQEARTPGRISVATMVPTWAPAGPAFVSSSRYYQCNITHLVLPILSQNNWAFTVQR